MAREASKRLLRMIENGLLEKDRVIRAFLRYMSEQDVIDMCRYNDFFDIANPDKTDPDYSNTIRLDPDKD